MQSAFSFFFPDPTILFSEKKRYGSGSYLKKTKTYIWHKKTINILYIVYLQLEFWKNQRKIRVAGIFVRAKIRYDWGTEKNGDFRRRRSLEQCDDRIGSSLKKRRMLKRWVSRFFRSLLWETNGKYEAELSDGPENKSGHKKVQKFSRNEHIFLIR